jgi:hypothetical protein
MNVHGLRDLCFANLTLSIQFNPTHWTASRQTNASMKVIGNTRFTTDDDDDLPKFVSLAIDI